MPAVIEDPLLKPIGDKLEAGARLTFEDGVALYRTSDILALGYLANRVRERLHGDRTYLCSTRAELEMNVGENGERRVQQLIELRDAQDRTGDFSAIAVLSADAARPFSGFDDLKNIAIARLMLDNIAHIQADWAAMSPRIAQIALRFGADSLTGTAAPDGRNLSLSELQRLVRKAGREPIDRSTPAPAVEGSLRVLA